jgi:hypothetical protein
MKLKALLVSNLLVTSLLGANAVPTSKTVRLVPLKSTVHHMSLTKAFLRDMARFFKVKTFVETGTAKGETSNVAKDLFDVHTIEIDGKLYNECKKRFAPFANVTVYHGDSCEKLPEILRKIKKPALFWLDGHNSPGLMGGDVNTPLLTELSLIKRAGITDAVILIDDIRCALWQRNDWGDLSRRFGLKIRTLFDQVGLGWPSIDEIVQAVKAINSQYYIALIGDVLIAYDGRTGVQLSPELLACSSLIFNQKLTEDKMMHYETIIARADDQAFKAIKETVEILSIHEEPCYHAHLHFWYGLMLLNRKNFKEAEHQFIQAKKGGFNIQKVTVYLAKAKEQRVL